MKRPLVVIGVSAGVALGAGSIGAQQPGASQPARNDGVTTPGDYEQTRSTPLTLIGCVDRAPNGAYLLRQARPGRAEAAGTAGSTTAAPTGSGATGTIGTTAGEAVDSPPRTWVLKSTTDLAPHVGHQVRITGVAHVQAGAGQGPTATTENPTTTATGARMQDAGTKVDSVEVEAVRMISRSCT